MGRQCLFVDLIACFHLNLFSDLKFTCKIGDQRHGRRNVNVYCGYWPHNWRRHHSGVACVRSHKNEKLRSLGISRYKFKFGFCTEEFEFLDLVDFEGVAFSVESAIHTHSHVYLWLTMPWQSCHTDSYVYTHSHIQVWLLATASLRCGQTRMTNIKTHESPIAWSTTNNQWLISYMHGWPIARHIWKMSHMNDPCKSHVTNMNELRCTYEWPISIVWMSHVSYTHELYIWMEFSGGCHVIKDMPRCTFTYGFICRHIWMGHECYQRMTHELRWRSSCCIHSRTRVWHINEQYWT